MDFEYIAKYLLVINLLWSSSKLLSDNHQQRRQRILDLLTQTNAAIALLGNRKKRRSMKTKRFWKRPGRTSTWWDNFIDGVVIEEEWKENFRMFKEPFIILCSKLQPFIEKQRTQFRKPISVEKQVAITLYYLADESRMIKIANAFGVGKCTVSNIVRRVCRAISTELAAEYLHWLPSVYWSNRRNPYSY